SAALVRPRRSGVRYGPRDSSCLVAGSARGTGGPIPLHVVEWSPSQNLFQLTPVAAVAFPVDRMSLGTHDAAAQARDEPDPFLDTNAVHRGFRRHEHAIDTARSNAEFDASPFERGVVEDGWILQQSGKGGYEARRTPVRDVRDDEVV